MFNCDQRCCGNCGRCSSPWLCTGQPILHAESQFVACRFSAAQFVPLRKIGRRHLKDVLRRAVADNNQTKRSFKGTNFCKTEKEAFKKEKSVRTDEFEMIYLSDSPEEEESRHMQNIPDKVNSPQRHRQDQQDQQQLCKLLRWISQEGEEFVHIETFTNLEDFFALLDAIAASQKPVLTTILIRETEPNLITMSLSGVKVDMQCLMFCMFQT